MNQLSIDPESTALLLIDLQHGVTARQLAPYSAPEVIEKAATLAAALRQRGGTIVYVRVKLSELPHYPADEITRDPNAPPPPAIASEIVPEAGMQEGDVLITKRQWGAFHATELDQQLRRRGIRTILMGGISTNIGVESTARAAFDHGYHLVFIEDAMTSLSAETHRFPIQHIFPRMGRVRTTEAVMEALAQ